MTWRSRLRVVYRSGQRFGAYTAKLEGFEIARGLSPEAAVRAAERRLAPLPSTLPVWEAMPRLREIEATAARERREAELMPVLFAVHRAGLPREVAALAERRAHA